MDKKKIEKQKQCSMEVFLRGYVGIENEEVIGLLTSLTHKQFKEVYEKFASVRLTRIPFEIVTTEKIETGEVILVLDSDNNIAPYINPIHISFEKIMEEELERQIDRLYNSENQIQTFEEYTDDLDEIALDKGTPNSKIKRLSLTRHKSREED